MHVTDFDTTDRDGSDQWGIASISHDCTKEIIAHCRITHGRNWVDVEVEESVPCQDCGLDLDANDLAAVVLEHFEAEMRRGIEDQEMRHAD